MQLTFSEEIDLLKQRLIALGSRELLFQVSPAKDVLRMEEELDELRSENLNLKIRLGDLENARGFNDLREPLEIQQGYKGKRCCGEQISVQSVLSTYGAQRAAPEVMWTKTQQHVMERTIKWKLQSVVEFGGKASTK